ncbi:MAG TPA: DNA mismatch repair protein MutS [Candidatus Dormibacteraeota bacterium]|nr:DNA mismatch repair protein MutS [Candidatus Dormibacteraeota bacterium]
MTKSASAETPVMRQYREAKERFPDAILLFRMGDFYEIFDEDAEQAAPIMGVTLTSRPLGKAGRHPMCGVPYHAWQTYVGRLVRGGRKVVICDQVEAPTGKGLVKREITRVLTPGTVVEDAYLEPSSANFLVAAWTRGDEAGLAACDISTCEFLLCQLPADRLAAELDRLRPAELLAPPEVEAYKFDPARGRERLREMLGIPFEAAIGAENAPLAVGAAGVVLDYLASNQVKIQPGLFRVRTYSPDATMPLDPATVANLELSALYQVLNRTVSPVGARRLRGWVWAPLRDVEAIELRLGAVAEMEGDAELRRDLREPITAMGDLERLTARAAQGFATARELVALRRSLDVLPAVGKALARAESLALRDLAARVRPAPGIAALLAAALVDDPPPHGRDGGAIRPGFDSQLDSIHDASRSARDWIGALEAAERARTGIKGLKVGYNRVFGYYLEVGAGSTTMVPNDYIRKQTLTGAERYLTPELKEREAIVLNAQQQVVARETEILRDLCARVAQAGEPVLASAQAAGEADAIQALATAAGERGWTRPAVNDGVRLEIVAGRHPLVELALPDGVFVPNDLVLDPDQAQVVILTGPNMAGKSTYLRQAALIALLAQAGSFVPARSVSLGLCDRIFTRVGAHDDLSRGMSTFMVEMTETANILNHATRASLVVFDEVGRGTSTYDGMSIAQAVVEYIHESPRLGCRTLFATHYHELTALADSLPRVRNQRVEVLEEGDTVRFLHRVVPGGADRSYGIHVAALAGLPATVIARARAVLGDLERQRPLEPAAQQLGLPLQVPADPLLAELEGLQLDSLTPLEALQKLYELKSRLS